MNTKFIGIKEFRQNIAEYADKARSKKDRFIVMRRNTPLFEIKPFSEGLYLDDLVNSITQAQKDVEKEQFYTHDQIIKEQEINE